jgi:hypothetical protein
MYPRPPYPGRSDRIPARRPCAALPGVFLIDALNPDLEESGRSDRSRAFRRGAAVVDDHPGSHWLLARLVGRHGSPSFWCTTSSRTSAAA